MFNPKNSNTWERVWKFGASAHAIGVAMLAIGAEQNNLELFSQEQQDIIKPLLPKLRNIIVKYASIHDSKDANIFSDISPLDAKNKIVEGIMAKVKLAKLTLEIDTNIDDFLDFINENPACLYQHDSIAKEKYPNTNLNDIKEQLDNFESSINSRINQELVKVNNDDNIDTYIFFRLLIQDTIGINGVVEYSKQKDDEKKREVILKTRESLKNEYKLLSSKIKEELPYTGFLMLQASKFIGDVQYYINLDLMLFDGNNKLDKGYADTLKRIFSDSNLDLQTEMPEIKYTINDGKQDIKIPALPKNWNTPDTRLYWTGIKYAEGMLPAFKTFTNIKPLTDDISNAEAPKYMNCGTKNGENFSVIMNNKTNGILKIVKQPEAIESMRSMVSNNFFINS